LPARGSYILLVELPEGRTIAVGSRQDIHFPRGYYAYVGSAMNGFKSRLGHHFKEPRRPHWHIDYLLQKASVGGIILLETEERIECTVAQVLNQQFDSIPGFGSSDCRCPSHLFFAPVKGSVESSLAMFAERVKTSIENSLGSFAMKNLFNRKEKRERNN